MDAHLLTQELADISQNHLCVKVGSLHNHRSFIITDIGSITLEQKQHLLQISKDPDIALWDSVGFIDIDTIKSREVLALYDYWRNAIRNIYGGKVPRTWQLLPNHFLVTWLQFCKHVEHRHQCLNENDFSQ